MAQDGPLAARQHARQPDGFLAENSMADRVHASVHGMQPSLAQTVVDGPLAEAKARELSSRQNTVLLLRQVGNRAVRLVSSQLTPIYVVNCDLVG
jgi:hypothetical protein